MRHPRAVLSSLIVPALVAAVALGGAGCSDDDGNGGTNPPAHELIDLTLMSDAALANHWPSTDGLIGTADDSVSASVSSVQGSSPNADGSLSYNAFDFGIPGSDAFLPDSMDAVTFLDGTLTVDHDVLDEGGGAIITDLDVSGTLPFPGHGAYSASFTAVNSGTFNPATHEFTLNVDFTANLSAGTANGVDLDLTGTAYIIHDADFGDPTGNDYLDDVVIPAAQALGATSVFFAEAEGTVPASTGGTGGAFPAMPVRAVIVAYTDHD